MASIETYITYQAIFGVASTTEQFETQMGAPDLGLILRLFSAVNTICARRGLSDRDAAQRSLIRDLFDEDTAQKTLQYAARHQGCTTVFHRKQCLFILREAMRLCTDQPGMQLMDVRRTLAMVSLMANDHASATAQKGSSQAEQIAASMCDFIPVTEANELRFEMASIPRMHKIVHDIAPARIREANYFDIPALFEKASKIPLDTYEALNLVVLPRVLKSPVDVLTQSPDYGIHVDFFAQTPLSLKQRNDFFGMIAKTPGEFRARFREKIPTLSDFTIFKETPFLRNPDRLVPIDITACVEKFEASVFWTIFQSLSEDQKQPFSSFWAAVFEDYID